MDKTILNPIIPYVGCIGNSGTFIPQNLIKIQGTIPENAYGFEISLQCGSDTGPDNNIALHISVKLLNGLISFNSFCHGTWGEEISKAIELIQSKEKFEIVVLCQENQYKITINGEDYYNYAQIIHYDMVSHLSITGDLSIIQICYESTAVDSSTKNVGETAEIFNEDEPLSSSRNELLPSDNGIDGTKIQHARVILENYEIKRGCKCKDIFYVFAILFVMVAVIGGLIYWYCSDDGTNVVQIKKGFRGVYGWYKNGENRKKLGKMSIVLLEEITWFG